MEEFERLVNSVIVISILSVFLLCVGLSTYEHFKPKSEAWKAGYSDYPNDTIYNEVKDNSSLIRTDEEADYMSGWEAKREQITEQRELDEKNLRENRTQRLVTDRVNQSKKMEMK